MVDYRNKNHEIEVMSVIIQMMRLFNGAVANTLGRWHEIEKWLRYEFLFHFNQ